MESCKSVGHLLLMSTCNTFCNEHSDKWIYAYFSYVCGYHEWLVYVFILRALQNQLGIVPIVNTNECEYNTT